MTDPRQHVTEGPMLHDPLKDFADTRVIPWAIRPAAATEETAALSKRRRPNNSLTTRRQKTRLRYQAQACVVVGCVRLTQWKPPHRRAVRKRSKC